jgi:hypothetical protein
MALLEFEETKQVTVSCSLKESTAILVDQYATWKGATADQVMQKALEFVFSKDREFQQYREENADAEVVPSLRVKKPIAASAKAKPERRQQQAAAL